MRSKGRRVSHLWAKSTFNEKCALRVYMNTQSADLSIPRSPKYRTFLWQASSSHKKTFHQQSVELSTLQESPFHFLPEGPNQKLSFIIKKYRISVDLTKLSLNFVNLKKYLMSSSRFCTPHSSPHGVGGESKALCRCCTTELCPQLLRLLF